MDVLGESISSSTVLFLLLALGLALSFEFVNGFHDAANAVATVIYTNTLPPTLAVVWSGIWNLLGVLTATGTVAFGVLALLPVELVLQVSSSAGFAMVFALLTSAILWNVGTWYLGLPTSSSHTLIGSIMGVGLAYSHLAPGQGVGTGVNWSQAQNVLASLLISPILGFSLGAILLWLTKWLIQNPELYAAPQSQDPPPIWIRGLLVLTCTGVSFAHGSNDGQKGTGLILLILIGIVPGLFALNLTIDSATLQHILTSSQALVAVLPVPGLPVPLNLATATADLSQFIQPATSIDLDRTLSSLLALNQAITDQLTGIHQLADLLPDDRVTLRSYLYLMSASLEKLAQQNWLTRPTDLQTIVTYKQDIDQVTQFIPIWVKMAVAVALGGGTLVGWKRIVVTVGEKIGQERLTYAQGAAAQTVAMGTIAAADLLGLPVSTTHVLSSGIAGTMAASRSGLQFQTLRHLAIAWILTFPACITLSAALFAVTFYLTTLFHPALAG